MAVETAPLSEKVVVADEVRAALLNKGPVVALESAVITHGLPHPRNLEIAHEMESTVRSQGATPATVAVLDGWIRVGLTAAEFRRLAKSQSNLKVGMRDFATMILKGETGGTTVAATMFAASRAGIRIFVTGGIGGVHKERVFDVSADLTALANIPMIVVCAGAKSVLDLPATLEYLETMGVPVIGIGTDEFPAFLTRTSGLKTSLRLDSPGSVAEYWAIHCGLGMQSAVLVANPIPEASALTPTEIETVTAEASGEALERGVRGQALTPFLLARVAELSEGRSVTANAALLLSNARLAAQIATAVTKHNEQREIQT